jgi:hypothetical protein
VRKRRSFKYVAVNLQCPSDLVTADIAFVAFGQPA